MPTHVATTALAWDCPVRMLDWAPAYMSSGEWDDKTRTATVKFETEKAPATIRVAVAAGSAVVQIDGQDVATKTVDKWKKWTVLQFQLTEGEHTLTVSPK